jgi:hypothetical protein
MQKREETIVILFQANKPYDTERLNQASVGMQRKIFQNLSRKSTYNVFHELS